MQSIDSAKNAVTKCDNKKILIVEDETEIVSFFSGMLQDDYRLRIVSSGKDALHQIRIDENIDLILLDYKLPDMSGVEVLQEIKKMKASIPVIFMTAYGSEDVAVKAFTAGAKDYIKKPFPFSTLAAKIEFCLSLKPKIAGKPCRDVLLPAQMVSSRNNQARNPNYYRILKSVKYIEDNYTAKVDLESVARKACISHYHYSRLFKEIMGLSFKNYLINFRMEKAKELLRSGVLSVSEIASAVGYDELIHFVKMFKKRTGYTPSQYRKKY